MSSPSFRAPHSALRVSRRGLIRTTAVGVAGYSASGWLDVLAARAAGAEPAARPRQCVVLWMSGGLSQIDTFDPKPEAPVDYRGHLSPIATAVPGIRVCNLLPKLAARMNDLAIVRSMSTRGGAHGGDSHDVHHAGLFQGRGVKPATLGAVVSATLGPDDFGMPTHVAIGKYLFDSTLGGPGFLGPRHAAMTVADPAAGLDGLRQAVPEADFRDRLGLLDELEKGFAHEHRLNAVEAHRVGYGGATAFMRSTKARAFDIGLEPAKVRDAYGRNQFGDACLLARRLVEIGMPFVEVKWNVPLREKNPSGTLAWDTHENNAVAMDKGLPILDAAFSRLLDDLRDRGRLDSTLIVLMGDFGRTPKPEGKAGRGHFGKAWSVVLAGGRVRGGQVYGKTTPDGTAVSDKPVSAAGLLATVVLALGLDPALEFGSRDGRRTAATRTAQDVMMAGPGVRLLPADHKPLRDLLN